MTSTAFISVVSEFLSVTQLDFVSVKITSLALTIITAKVIREAQSYQKRAFDLSPFLEFVCISGDTCVCFSIFSWSNIASI